MAVTFVIGRAGSGKTHRCFWAIAQAMRDQPLGSPIFWILPKQATFNAERELTCAAGLDAFCRARVVSFEQLAELIISECGGGAVPEVTGIGRQMVLGHLLRQLQPQLQFFGSVARQAGLAVELDQTFAELERSGKDASDLASIIDELEQLRAPEVEGQALASKLRDLRLLYDAYQKFLGQDRLDQHRRMEQVLEAAEHCALLKGASVYVDGFLEFSEFQRRMLVSMAKAGARIEIALLMDPESPVVANPHHLAEEMDLFHRTQGAYRKLWFAFSESGIEVTAPILLRDARRFENQTMARVERGFEMGPPLAASDRQLEKKRAKPQAVFRIEAPSFAEEISTVAREIRLLLAQGYRLRDIVVLARDLEPYHTLIQTVFDEHEIPYFVDRRRSASHHALLEFLRSALQIARFDWPHDAVMSLLKTGLASVNADDADELENYVLLHRIRSEGWESERPWTYRRGTLISEEDTPPLQNHDPMRMDALRRRVVDRLLAFINLIRQGRQFTVRSLATAVVELFERFEIRPTLSQWMSAVQTGNAPQAISSIEHRDEHEQVWTNLIELFEQMVDLLGDQLMTVEEFAEVLESGLEHFDLAMTPPTVDQVLVGQIDRTICPRVRAAFVLGLNEGQFPAIPHDQTVLTDRERRELGRRKVELDRDARRQAMDEPLLAYMAFTRASERLIVTRATADEDGRVVQSSSFWHRLEQIVPDVITTTIPPSGGFDVERLTTPRELITAAMKWASEPTFESTAGSAPRTIDQTDATCDPWPSLYQWLAIGVARDGTLSFLLHRAWPALRYNNTADISADANRLLFASPLAASVAQLESFAACPFQHFARYGLSLTSRSESDVTLADLSQIYHRVLEDLLKPVIQAKPDWDQDPLPINDQMIDAAVGRAGHALRGELMLSSARNRYLLRRTARAVRQMVESQRELLKRWRFRPAASGIEFGKDARLPALALKTPNGSDVQLRGKIDRIETLPEGNDAVALDYRLAIKPLSLASAYHGLSLQLLTHLLVLQSYGQQIAGKELQPSAAFYMQLLRSHGDVDHPDEALDPNDARFLLALKPRGVFDGRCFPNLDSEASEGWSLAINAFLKKQGGFGNKRSSDVAEGEEFAALLELTRQRIGEITDRILVGDVSIAPYRLNQQSPCARCDYRSVCRFETTVNRYRILESMGREQVLERLVEKSSAESDA